MISAIRAAILRLRVDLATTQVRNICVNVLDVLVELHSIDPDAAALNWISTGAGYVGRQVVGWSGRCRAAKTWNVRSFESVMAWLADNQLPDCGTVLVHNDFRFDNIVLDRSDPTRVIGPLDWEMATIGDPLMDLVGALAYWVQGDDGAAFKLFRRQPTHTPGMLTRREVVEHYCRRRDIGLSEREWAFYGVFGLFPLAVICRQIYYPTTISRPPTPTSDSSVSPSSSWNSAAAASFVEAGKDDHRVSCRFRRPTHDSGTAGNTGRCCRALIIGSQSPGTGQPNLAYRLSRPAIGIDQCHSAKRIHRA